jgi:predicted transcriptional regulator
MISREEYNSAPVIKAHDKMWFLNGDLVRSYHLNRSNGIMSVYNVTKGQIESCLISDFKKNRERAYSLKKTAELVNRHVKYLPTLIKDGEIPEPMGAQKGGGRKWQVRAYYSESQVREIRDILATKNIGRPRKDGLINNNTTPTVQELTRRMGDGMLTYTRTEDGRFIPLWSETV